MSPVDLPVSTDAVNIDPILSENFHFKGVYHIIAAGAIEDYTFFIFLYPVNTRRA